MVNPIPVTILDFINFSSDLLKRKNISEPRLTSELMLCGILNCRRMNLYLEFDKPLKRSETELLKSFLKRRISREPLQYILGNASFYGVEIKLNKHVLIPRPETELLVENVLIDIRNNERSEVTLFEIGSGSGCISIALAKQLEKEKIKYNIFSIDISEKAIAAAKENRLLNDISDVNLKFIVKDVMQIEKLNRSFDYIISNPPYISFSEFKLLEPEVKDFEPDLALTDFNNGLRFYEKIFSIATDASFIGKIFCEIGAGQQERIELLLKEKNFSRYSFIKDYSNIPRIVKAEK